ncbi:LysR family transcriptional regulator [Halomonas cupida]|uniref:LysR family transcriptional regulator n=1 Tax=Halomonas cupida TaxID=44933 RepID=UPI0039B6182E
MRYDLTTLHIFLCVAEERSLTRASARVHLAVSAISKRIAELESRLGITLFIRSSRGVELTAEGQSMLTHTRQIFHNIQAMDDEILGYSEGIRGQVKLHSTTSALAQFLPEDIETFCEKYPGIKLEVEGRLGTAIVNAIIDGSADLGVFALQEDVEGIETFQYRSYELAVALSSKDPLSSASSLSFQEVARHELVSQHSESLLYKRIQEEARKLGIDLKIDMKVSSYDCICQLVAIRRGIAILPRNIIDIYSNVVPITAVTLDEPWAIRELRVGVRSYRMLAPPVKALLNHLTRH